MQYIFTTPLFSAAFPEIFLALMTLVLLLLGASRGKGSDYTTISRFAILSLLAAAVAVCRFGGEPVKTFSGMFLVDRFGDYMKLLVLAGSAISLGMASGYVERERIGRFEYPLLVMFSALGMMLMISANNLMALYMGLELQSLPLYVLAGLQRDAARSTEAGVKYFVLGALASGMLLYGASLIYGYTGTTGFDEIRALFAGGATPAAGVVFGMILLLSGLAFKISAVPFHMWTPDVYEGAPTSVTAFFAIVPKVAGLALIVRVFAGPFGPIPEQWQQVVALISAASMVLGALAAIGQPNIKRLLAYSSIGHMGYVLMGLAAANFDGVGAIMIYLAIYMLSGIGAFAVVLMMKKKDRMVEKVSDLAGVARTQPLLALAMTIMMFSMAGIPPLAGFFGKLFIFESAVEAKLYTLAVLGVVSSVVAAYYYLYIIKVMYFDEPGDEQIDAPADGALNFTLACASAATVAFAFVPAPLVVFTSLAAQSLLTQQ
jgi:NADH-quinone oxidoreductase subunit N